MDNTTFKELLDAGEIGLIMADGAQALTKKQLGTIIQRTQESIGRNIPESFQLKAKSTSNLKLEKPQESPFLTPIGVTRNTRLKKGDSAAAILAKMFSFMKKTHEEKKLRKELDKNFKKEQETARREKKKSTKKPKTESKLENFLKNLQSSFKNSVRKLLGFLTKLAIVAFIFETQKEVEKVVEDFEKLAIKIEEVKKSIIDGIDKIKNWFASIDIFGYKPFDFEGGGKKAEPEKPTTTTPIETKPKPTENKFKRFKEIVASSESKNYNAIQGFPSGDPSIPRSHNGKDLSELTIGEVLKIQEPRKQTNSSAAGKYQFTYATLQGLYKNAGLSLSDPFSPENQEKLYDTFTEQNKKLLTKTLGREPTYAELGIASLAGAGGGKKPGATEIIKAAKETPNKQMFDVLGFEKGSEARKKNPQLEGVTAGKYVSDREKQFKVLDTIPDINPIKLNDTLKSTESPPNITPLQSGDNTQKLTMPIESPKINSDKLSSLFKENENKKEEMVSSNIIINNSQTNNIIGSNPKTQILNFATPLDLPFFLQGQI
jgi:hypothetical protein